MLSIVVPTLNEEKYLLRLLSSIKRQSFKDFEIVVADSGSEDKTLEVARREGCKLAPGAGRLPAKAKNRGAEIAQGEIILFVDADVILPDNFLNSALDEFKERNLDVASFALKAKNAFHNFLHSLFYNFLARAGEKILPQAMNIILVKKTVHNKIGGFDEEIRLGEELYYVRKGAKAGEFGVLKSVKGIVSLRRYHKDGCFKTWLKYFLCQIHMIFLGPVRSDVFRYRFNHYKES